MSTSVELTWNGDELKRDMEESAVTATEAVAEQIRSDLVEKLSRPESDRSGRTYQRGEKTHVASAPYEPPARDTGHLAQSVAWVVQEVMNSVQARIGPNTVYDMALEFGYPPRNLKPRPYVRPVWEENKEAYLDRWEREFRLAMGRKGWDV